MRKNNILKKKYLDILIISLYWFNRLIFKKRFNAYQKARLIVSSENKGSLKGCDDLKCIYVHIPKAGGVSINKALFGNLGGGHLSILNYATIFSYREFKQYYKFTFVRNPWARLYSAYTFLKKGGMNAVDKKWAEANLNIFDSFEEFVQSWVDDTNIHSFIHFVPQYKFLMINGKIVMDDIFKIENINNDYQTVCKRLGIENSLKHLNKTQDNKVNYRVFYTEEMRNIVAKFYEEDISLFDYHF